MALPVFKTGLSMQVDRWVRLPPSPAIFVLRLGFRVGVQVDSAVSNRAYRYRFVRILGMPFYARGLRIGVQVDSARFQTAPTDVVSFVFWGCRLTLLAADRRAG